MCVSNSTTPHQTRQVRPHESTARSALAPLRWALRRRRNGWSTPSRVDMSAAPPPPRPITLASTPQQVTLDLNRTRADGHRHAERLLHRRRLGRSPRRRLSRPTAGRSRRCSALLPAWRAAGGQVIWVNWGNRPDLANMPPNQHHLYKPQGQGIGLGEPLPGHGAPVLQKDSWAAAVVDELSHRADRHLRRQAPHQRLLGHAARLDPAQSGHAHDPVRRRQHRPVRAAHA